jgi:hypothetical protein
VALLGSLLRVAAGGALLAVILLAVARLGAPTGMRGHAGIPETLLAIGPDRWRDIALLGAAIALGTSLLNRLLPEGTARALRGGFWTGVLAMVFIQQGITFLLHHLFRALPDAGFSLLPLPGWWHMPQLVALALAGGIAGAVLSLLLRWLPWPDLLAGLAFGTFGLALLAGDLPLPPLPIPPLTAQAPGWWANLAANGGWGLGAALLMRPLVLRSEGGEPE